MSTHFFTVFTPTYNRKNEIHRVWESLNNQTFRDFEWIVVDDGSTDNIWSFLEQYKKEALFPVTLLQQENLGKHFAWNRALDIAKGELFVPADSDDRFLPHTLQFFYEKWNAISANERSKYSGINVLCKNSVTGEIVGNKYPQDELISNNLELYYKYNVHAEKWGCIRTDLLQKNKYPEIKGRGNYIQNYTWYSLAKHYKVLCFNEVLRIYYTAGDSITNKFTSKTYENFKFAASILFDYLMWHLNNNKWWMLRYDKVEYIKSVINLCRNGFPNNRTFFDLFLQLKGFLNKVSLTIFYIPSLIYFKLFDSKR